MNEEHISEKLTSLFRFRDDISDCCTTSVESILNDVLHKMSMWSSGTCFTGWVTSVSVDVEVQNVCSKRSYIVCL